VGAWKLQISGPSRSGLSKLNSHMLNQLLSPQDAVWISNICMLGATPGSLHVFLSITSHQGRTRRRSTIHMTFSPMGTMFEFKFKSRSPLSSRAFPLSKPSLVDGAIFSASKAVTAKGVVWNGRSLSLKLPAPKRTGSHLCDWVKRPTPQRKHLGMHILNLNSH